MTGEPMRQLILVKHAHPEIRQDVPAARWPLSERGRVQCLALAEALRPLVPTSVIASLEPKATETGELVSRHLGLSFATAPDLHEHDRSNVTFLSPTEFHQSVKKFFCEPKERVFGEESAEETNTRFSAALDSIHEQTIGARPIIVAHGTVISLYASQFNDLNAYELWSQLELPAIVVLSMPEHKLVRIVPSVE